MQSHRRFTTTCATGQIEAAFILAGDQCELLRRNQGDNIDHAVITADLLFSHAGVLLRWLTPITVSFFECTGPGLQGKQFAPGNAIGNLLFNRSAALPVADIVFVLFPLLPFVIKFGDLGFSPVGDHHL